MELPPEVEVIESTRRYVFGLRGDEYGVWDRRSPAEPIERFPGTDEGYGRAERLFEELRALDFRARGVFPHMLVWGVFVAAGVWIASLLLQLMLFFASSSPGFDTAFRDLNEIDLVSRRVALGGLVLLAAMTLLRSERSSWVRSTATVPASGEVEMMATPPKPKWVTALVWVLGVGAVTWTTAGVLTRTAFRYEPGQFLVTDQRPSLGVIVADTIEVAAFRVFVVALVALLVWWAWPRVHPPEG